MPAEGGSNATRDLLVGLRILFCVHGAVQSQQNAAHLGNRTESFDQPPAERFKCFGRHRSLRSRAGMEDGNKLVSSFSSSLDETSGLRVTDRPQFESGLRIRTFPEAELGQRRLLGVKGVGLVKEVPH